MTVAIGLVTGDGAVVATESRTCISPQGLPPRVLSDATQKVFDVAGVAVATYGVAFIGGRTIQSHMAELIVDLADLAGHAEVEAIAHQVAEFFDQRLAGAGAGNAPLGFLLAGAGEGSTALFEVSVPGSKVHKLGDSSTPTAAWRGQTDVLRRLVKGVDWDLLLALAPDGPPRQALEQLHPPMTGLEYIIPFDLMNIEDGVEFARFAIRTTVEAQRFTHGTRAIPGSFPGAGGPVQIAVVTPADGLRLV